MAFFFLLSLQRSKKNISDLGPFPPHAAGACTASHALLRSSLEARDVSLCSRGIGGRSEGGESAVRGGIEAGVEKKKA